MTKGSTLAQGSQIAGIWGIMTLKENARTVKLGKSESVLGNADKGCVKDN